MGLACDADRRLPVPALQRMRQMKAKKKEGLIEYSFALTDSFLLRTLYVYKKTKRPLEWHSGVRYSALRAIAHHSFHVCRETAPFTVTWHILLCYSGVVTPVLQFAKFAFGCLRTLRALPCFWRGYCLRFHTCGIPR